jgi:hypothetical protein
MLAVLEVSAIAFPGDGDPFGSHVAILAGRTGSGLQRHFWVVRGII